MVLAMDGHPFLGVDSRGEPQLQAHRKGHERIEVEAAMGQ